MTTEDEVMRLLRRADPDRGRADRPAVDGTQYLAALRTRSTTVTLTDIEPAPTQPEGRHRWPVIAVAAAAVVAIVVGAVMLGARDDSEPPAPADTTVAPVAPDVADDATAAEEVARGFLDTYAASDADQALTYITESAIAALWGSVEVFRGDLAWNAATDYRIMVSDCVLLDDDPEAGITLRCGFDFHQLGSDALGIDPYGDNWWDLTVRDGEIVSASSQGTGSDRWFNEMLLPFNDWIMAEHPDDVVVMYTDDSQGDRQLTEESLQLWGQRTQEYVQTLLTSREAYPADVAAVCATQVARLEELTLPAEGALDQVATWNTAAAAILQQTRAELIALDEPPLMDTAVYSVYDRQLIRVVGNFEETAEAATAGDSTRLAELEAEYLDLREVITSGPAGSGLEECLASLPS